MMEQLSRIPLYDGFMNRLPAITETNNVWDHAHYVVIPDQAAFEALCDYVDGNESLESTARPSAPGWWRVIVDEYYCPSYWTRLGGDAKAILSIAENLGMDPKDAFMQLCC